MLEPLNLSSVEGAGSRDHVLAGADQRTFYRSGALQYRWSRFDFITSSEYMPNSYGFFFVFSTTTTITFSVVLHLFGGGGLRGTRDEIIQIEKILRRPFVSKVRFFYEVC